MYCTFWEPKFDSADKLGIIDYRFIPLLSMKLVVPKKQREQQKSIRSNKGVTFQHSKSLYLKYILRTLVWLMTSVYTALKLLFTWHVAKFYHLMKFPLLWSLNTVCTGSVTELFAIHATKTFSWLSLTLCFITHSSATPWCQFHSFQWSNCEWRAIFPYLHRPGSSVLSKSA